MSSAPPFTVMKQPLTLSPTLFQWTKKPGRLNTKKYIGGSRHTLSQMQTDFAVEVKDLGLDRGIQGSKAKTYVYSRIL